MQGILIEHVISRATWGSQLTGIALTMDEGSSICHHSTQAQTAMGCVDYHTSVVWLEAVFWVGLV